MIFDQSKALQKKSHALIPGGAHTYAKGDDQYPELAPGFLETGKGCHVWDLDGNEFIEYGMGLRSITLGHGYAPVIEAAYQQMLKGINFTRPSSIEVECAEKLLSLIDGAEMAKFAKNGSDVTSGCIASGARLHWSRYGGSLRRTPLLLCRRLVHRDYGHECGHSRSHQQIDRQIPLQQHRKHQSFVRDVSEPHCMSVYGSRAVGPSRG